MKKIILILLLCFLFTNFAIASDVYVNGYYRQNGTYVSPYIRSSPDSYTWNNYGQSKNSDGFRQYSNDYNSQKSLLNSQKPTF